MKISETALISVIFSFLPHLGEVKYHWSKSGKSDQTVNLIIVIIIIFIIHVIVVILF